MIATPAQYAASVRAALSPSLSIPVPSLAGSFKFWMPAFLPFLNRIYRFLFGQVFFFSFRIVGRFYFVRKLRSAWKRIEKKNYAAAPPVPQVDFPSP